PGKTFNERVVAWSERAITIEAELNSIQREIDARSFALYVIDEADRRVIIDGFGDRSGESVAPEEPESDADPDDEDEIDNSADAASLASELMSWAVGVALGRFDIRLATGTKALALEPQTFDPLP